MTQTPGTDGSEVRQTRQFIKRMGVYAVKKTAVLVMLALLASAPGWAAFTLGTDITVWDGLGAKPVSGHGEDNETEPGTVQGQEWDLEGFFLTSDNVLQLVGGYNFYGGIMYGNDLIMPGDLFIDVDGLFGSRDHGSHMGYEYAVSWVNVANTVGNNSPEKATVYKLGRGVELLSVTDITDSDPWKLGDSGVKPGRVDVQNSVTYTPDVRSLDEVSLWNGRGVHNIVEFDLNWLIDDMKDEEWWTGEINVHYTYQCGNDLIKGSGSLVLPDDPGVVIPEPASITLMGLGIAAVAVSRLRKAA